MIEINFVEKKKINTALYLLLAIFMVSLLIISISFFILHTSLENKYVSLQQERIDKSEIIAEINTLNMVEQQKQTLKAQIEQLETAVYPSLFLLDDIQADLPNDTFIENYSFTITNGVTVGIHLNALSEAANFSQNINGSTYAENVNLINLEKIDDYYVATFNFGINADYLVEEAD
ncbi:PilN domain-containing protein [Paraliobacillus sp. X-1268]|uniref:PilN domain-containing protein n=1 Tax=Paraliobacillus sp. X-1268 TaxID=2213193 RepID=UPI000E3DC3F8|nr:hypothetical protein [Paraliobacillus sp. X-1268]